MTHRKIQILAACLKDGGYKSSQLYIDAAFYHHEHVLQHEVSASMRKAAKRLARAATRGIPGAKLKQAFDLRVLAVLVRFGPADGPLDCRRPHHAVDVVIIACWFMLREIEIAGARVQDLTLSSATFAGASLWIYLSIKRRRGARRS